MKKRDRKILVFSAKKRKEDDKYDTYKLLADVIEESDGGIVRQIRYNEYNDRFHSPMVCLSANWYIFVSPVNRMINVHVNHTELRNFPRRNQTLKKLRGK